MEKLDFVDLDHYLLSQNGHIIHQIWFGTIPNKSSAKASYKKLKNYRDSWIIKNPSWCRIEWDKNMCLHLVKTFFPQHLDMFKKYKYEIQRCDTIRYLILYRYGGWYADMDYYCNRPLDEAMSQYKNDIYFVQSPNRVLGQDDDHISNSLMYSVPRHAFWKQIMVELEKSQNIPKYYTKHLAVMFSSGPGILNRIYSKYKYRYRVKSLPWKLFHPYGIGDEKLFLNKNKDVYTIHLGRGSWEGKDSKFLIMFRDNIFIIFYIIFVFSLSLVLTRIKF
jgi:mannosyltransferase OCH1-like enzyme